MFGQEAWEKAQAIRAKQVIPPVPSLFTLLRPYLAHFFPVFSRFLCVFTASPRRFQRAPSRNPGPRNSGHDGQEGRTPLFVRHPRCRGKDQPGESKHLCARFEKNRGLGNCARARVPEMVQTQLIGAE